jgi:hypothetical protein
MTNHIGRGYNPMAHPGTKRLPADLKTVIEQRREIRAAAARGPGS